jgi:hypothetical protein
MGRELVYPGCTLHQIGPYVGKMRPALARDLVARYSRPHDVVWDPFCGSGTVPLECRLMSRGVVAGDVNHYACALTRAKLHAPVSHDSPLATLAWAAERLGGEGQPSVQSFPAWVRRLFHTRTLRETVGLARVLSRRRAYFSFGCLLGILHHERPGFLSFPAAYFAPYLRDRLYPRREFPAAYEYKDPLPRLAAKIKRSLAAPPPPRECRFRVLQRSAMTQYTADGSIDAVITSPPYMNSVDYARDNRLRLWLLGVCDYREVRAVEVRRVQDFGDQMAAVLGNIVRALRPGGNCILVVGRAKRGGREYDVPGMLRQTIQHRVPSLVVAEEPYVGCARAGTVPGIEAEPREEVLVFHRASGRRVWRSSW